MVLNNKLILAIDKNNLNEAKSLCLEVKDDIGCFKLGMEFFYSFGKEGINEIAKLGVPIFLDLKLHDIPNTVLKSSLSLLKDLKNINILTVHASGGIHMMQATNENLKTNLQNKPALFGVTVLTSTNETDHWEGKKVTFPFAMAILRAINKIEKLQNDKNIVEFIRTRIKNMVSVANYTLNYWTNIYQQEHDRIIEVNNQFNNNKLIKDLTLKLECACTKNDFYKKNILSGGILNQVLHLSNLSYQSGIEGVVCSAMEAKFVKTFFPKLQIITPGIRPKWYNKTDDQSRVLTPNQAINNGADYLVIGRPITEAYNPRDAIKKTLAEIF